MTASDATFIFIVAGEPSGDALGGALIAALRQRTGGSLRIAGIGGERMREQGLESLVPLGDLAIMGVAEVLPRAPVILRRVRETVAAICAWATGATWVRSPSGAVSGPMTAIQIFSEPFSSTPCSFHSVRPLPRP